MREAHRLLHFRESGACLSRARIEWRILTRSAQSIPLGLSLGEASAALLAVFTIGAVANAGRATLMRLAGQRIVARLRERTYAAALRQEVEFVEKGEGDVISRLSVDSSIVGERYAAAEVDGLGGSLTLFVKCDTKPLRWVAVGHYGICGTWRDVLHLPAIDPADAGCRAASVSRCSMSIYFQRVSRLTPSLGVLRSLLETSVKQDTRGIGRHDEGMLSVHSCLMLLMLVFRLLRKH